MKSNRPPNEILIKYAFRNVMFYETSLYYGQYQWLVHYVYFIGNIYFLSSPSNLTRKPLLRRRNKWQLFGTLFIMIVVKIIRKI